MNFKNITIDDKDIMNVYLMENQYGICDYSFANIFAWQGTYETTYCIHNGFLILRSRLGDNLPAFMMPVGTGDLEKVIGDMLKYSEDVGERFRIASLIPEMYERIKPFVPDNFSVTISENTRDYIYLSESLISLTGKKLAAKRNHINKFMSVYGDKHEFVEINQDNIDEYKEMNLKWCRERDCNKTDTDFCAAERALENFEQLELRGLGLRVGGELCAFAIGQPNNSEMFDVIAEKALKTVDNAYPMINREFAARFCSSYKYINREEDMGVYGLRKAKLSYHPNKMLDKNLGVLN